jgi:hypothetical protein
MANNIDEIITAIRNGLVKVTFLKKDGSLRIMKCTLDMESIPAEHHPKNQSNQQTESDQCIRVYEPDEDGWRSFLFDSVQSYEVLTVN